MIRPALLASALLSIVASLSFPTNAQAAPGGARTRINAIPAREGWFVCDAIDGPYALFAGRVEGGRSLITLLDRRTGRFDTRSYQVGDADAGAGQIHWPLSRDGRAVGDVHGVNPGMIEEGGATVPPIVGVRIDEKQLECRFLAHARFLGVDSRRSVVVTEGAKGLVYQSFDFSKRGPIVRPDGVQRSNRPTLRLLGGSEVTGARGGFRFANAGYVYYVQRPVGGAAAALVVTRGGRLVQSEKLVGFTYAPPLGRAPVTTSAALGADAVWSGEGLDACRKAEGKAVGACLLDLMGRGRASAGSIAFTRRLIAAGDPGYVSGWKQAGPVGIASVTYPFRANTNGGTWLVPAIGDPIDVDAYELTAQDKARADYKAAQENDPDAAPVPPGEVSIGRAPDGNPRILVITATASCHACAPSGQIVVAYDFDASGHFLGASLIAAA